MTLSLFQHRMEDFIQASIIYVAIRSYINDATILLDRAALPLTRTEKWKVFGR
jgi:hypothetical protein